MRNLAQFFRDLVFGKQGVSGFSIGDARQLAATLLAFKVQKSMLPI